MTLAKNNNHMKNDFFSIEDEIEEFKERKRKKAKTFPSRGHTIHTLFIVEYHFLRETWEDGS
jgi:hypothetical protein